MSTKKICRARFFCNDHHRVDHDDPLPVRQTTRSDTRKLVLVRSRLSHHRRNLALKEGNEIFETLLLQNIAVFIVENTYALCNFLAQEFYHALYLMNKYFSPGVMRIGHWQQPLSLSLNCVIDLTDTIILFTDLCQVFSLLRAS